MSSRTFKDLIVWQKAHYFVLEVYRISHTLPGYELYGLTSQLKRAAVSIPANIAEGYKKKTKLDKARFFNIAQGSIEECRYYLILCKDLHYLDDNSINLKLEETSKLLNAYIKSMLTSGS